MTETMQAFLTYVRPHWGKLRRVAARYAAGRDDADDMVQETLLRAWNAFAPTDDRTYRSAWLFVIMRNLAMEWHRKSQRRVDLIPTSDSELTELAVADAHEPLAPFPAMDEGQFTEMLDDRMADALNSLDDSFREVLLLSVAGELSYREISEVIGRPVGTVMSRMARARRALRERLAHHARSQHGIKEARP